MQKTYDAHVSAFAPIIYPNALLDELPITAKVGETVLSAREQIGRILKKEDP